MLLLALLISFCLGAKTEPLSAKEIESLRLKGVHICIKEKKMDICLDEFGSTTLQGSCLPTEQESATKVAFFFEYYNSVLIYSKPNDRPYRFILTSTSRSLKYSVREDDSSKIRTEAIELLPDSTLAKVPLSPQTSIIVDTNSIESFKRSVYDYYHPPDIVFIPRKQQQLKKPPSDSDTNTKTETVDSSVTCKQLKPRNMCFIVTFLLVVLSSFVGIRYLIYVYEDKDLELTGLVIEEPAEEDYLVDPDLSNKSSGNLIAILISSLLLML